MTDEKSIAWDVDYSMFLSESKEFFSLFDLPDADGLSKTFSEILSREATGSYDALEVLSHGWAMFDMLLMCPDWDHFAFLELLPYDENKEMNDQLNIHLAVAARLRDRLACSHQLPHFSEISARQNCALIVRGELMRAVYPLKMRQLVDLDCDGIVCKLRSIRELRGGTRDDQVEEMLRKFL